MVNQKYKINSTWGQLATDPNSKGFPFSFFGIFPFSFLVHYIFPCSFLSSYLLNCVSHSYFAVTFSLILKTYVTPSLQGWDMLWILYWILLVNLLSNYLMNLMSHDFGYYPASSGIYLLMHLAWQVDFPHEPFPIQHAEGGDVLY